MTLAPVTADSRPDHLTACPFVSVSQEGVLS